MKIITGDAVSILASLPDQSVQCCVTSPPYFGLRSYLPDDHPDKSMEIGLEPTTQAYVERIVAVFKEVRRVLREDGTLWLNLGDSYAGQHIRYDGKEKKWQHGVSKTRKSEKPLGAYAGIKPKQLIGIPWRVAFALQDDGWYLRQDIIWHKINPMPESVADRCTKAHEYLFLLAKSKRYYFDAAAIAQPITESSKKRLSQPNLPNQQGSDRVQGKTNGNMKAVGPRFGGDKYGDDDREESRTKSGNEYTGGNSFANRRSVWTVATTHCRDAHFAVMPDALVEPCILAGSRSGDTVLDPFFGSGTVGRVAERLGRDWIGIDLNPDYLSIQQKRTAQAGLCL